MGVILSSFSFRQPFRVKFDCCRKTGTSDFWANFDNRAAITRLHTSIFYELFCFPVSDAVMYPLASSSLASFFFPSLILIFPHIYLCNLLFTALSCALIFLPHKWSTSVGHCELKGYVCICDCCRLPLKMHDDCGFKEKTFPDFSRVSLAGIKNFLEFTSTREHFAAIFVINLKNTLKSRTVSD